jgi:hypothetical protein
VHPEQLSEATITENVEAGLGEAAKTPGRTESVRSAQQLELMQSRSSARIDVGLDDVESE